jgi:hypothetical protein
MRMVSAEVKYSDRGLCVGGHSLLQGDVVAWPDG